MDRIKLNHGGEIPKLGFGTYRLIPNWRAKKAVLAALKTGYRLIDTARIYANEKGVGAAIRQSGIPRREIFVTTKLWAGRQGYDSALKAFNASLGRLELDYVDLYLIHWPSGQRQDSWRALQEIQQSGRAKAIGVSNYTIGHLEELLADAKVIPAVNQIEFHPWLYKEQAPTLEFCAQHKITVEAYSPLAQGQLLDNAQIGQIGRRHGKSNAQVVLRWAIQHGTVPIPKSTHPKRMAENLAVFDFELSKAEMLTIDNLSDGTRVCADPNAIL